MTLKWAMNSWRPHSISMPSSALAAHSDVCAGSITTIWKQKRLNRSVSMAFEPRADTTQSVSTADIWTS